MKKECINCGKKTNLLELKNGAFACLDCLDTIGREQRELRDIIKQEFGDLKEEQTIQSLINILNFVKKTSIENFNHLINALEAINYSIKVEEGTIEPEILEELQKTLEKWQNSIDNN